MEILSENIYKYIINNIDLKDKNEIELSDIEQLQELNLNRLNYNLKEARFIPAELAYFKNLQILSFNGFRIDDDIKANIEKLENLKNIGFNNCKIRGTKTIKNKITQVYMDYSDFNFIRMFEDKTEFKKITLKNITDVDIKELYGFENVDNLELLNCKILNCKLLLNLKHLKKIKIIGCDLDNDEIIEKLEENVEIIFSQDEFYYTG